MKRVLRASRLLLAGFVILCAIAPAPSQDVKNPYADWVGKPVADYQPDFAVDGKPLKLSELKGKVILLEVFQGH